MNVRDRDDRLASAHEPNRSVCFGSKADVSGYGRGRPVSTRVCAVAAAYDSVEHNQAGGARPTAAETGECRGNGGGSACARWAKPLKMLVSPAGFEPATY